MAVWLCRAAILLHSLVFSNVRRLFGIISHTLPNNEFRSRECCVASRCASPCKHCTAPRTLCHFAHAIFSRAWLQIEFQTQCQANRVWSDLPPFPLPQRLPLYFYHLTVMNTHPDPRTAGRFGSPNYKDDCSCCFFFKKKNSRFPEIFRKSCFGAKTQLLLQQRYAHKPKHTKDTTFSSKMHNPAHLAHKTPDNYQTTVRKRLIVK